MSTTLSLGPVEIVPGAPGRTRMGRLNCWQVLANDELLGLYFCADKHSDDGSLHRISLRKSKKILPHLIELGLPKYWMDDNYVDGGPGWEWAGKFLEKGLLPLERNEQEPLLALMAQRFESVIKSMYKEDGTPEMTGWSSPAVSTILVKSGWPISEQAKQAWTQAYEVWNDFRSSKPVEISEIFCGPRGERTVVQKDGLRRPCLNIERVAHPENQWLYEDALFSEAALACLGVSSTSPAASPAKKHRP